MQVEKNNNSCDYIHIKYQQTYIFSSDYYTYYLEYSVIYNNKCHIHCYVRITVKFIWQSIIEDNHIYIILKYIIEGIVLSNTINECKEFNKFKEILMKFSVKLKCIKKYFWISAAFIA